MYGIKNKYVTMAIVEKENLKFARKILRRKDFPELLREIADPPEKIYLIGDIPGEKRSKNGDASEPIFLAVVGTRKFSPYGERACEKIIRDLAQSGHNFVIVSGLALGIDAIAHRAALNNNLKTVGIPGSGLDDSVLHPRSNRILAHEIVENGGCLLSEFDWELPAGIHTFLQRNRIIAGLSRGTLVVEAPQRSGALNTARHTLEFNRDVFSVPGSIFSENSKGTNKLIKNGAIPVSSGRDILEAFNLINDDDENPPAGGQNQKSLFDLSPLEEKIFAAVSEPVAKDDLIRKLKMPVGEINSCLTMMQIRGIIRESGGEVCRK